jgi:hypothetical protein
LSIWFNGIQPQFRTIVGSSIRYAESEDRDDQALLLNPWPESLFAFEPIEALPGWSWDARADAWAVYVDRLRAFAEREGHARVPQRHTEHGTKLGTWVAVQRRYRATLPPERRAQLEAIPGREVGPVRGGVGQKLRGSQEIRRP